MSIEQMKQWFEALENEKALNDSVGVVVDATNEAITSLRQSIAEAEKQEPVAYEIQEGKNFSLVYAAAVDKYNMVAKENVVQSLYTHPQPKREQFNWEPIHEFWRNNSSIDWDELEKAIEAAHGIGKK